MSDEIEAPPPVDSRLHKQINSVVLQWMQMDDPTMGLYYLEDFTGPTLFLEARNANPITYTKKKMMYVFLKTNIILDPKVVYKDKYNNEYTRVPKEVVQTYHFGGLPLYDAIGQVRTMEPKPNIQSLPRENSRQTMTRNKRDPTSITQGVPLPTSTVKVGEGLGFNGENPSTRRSTTPHPSMGTTFHETMGAFPLRPPIHAPSQRKLRPSDFKKLVKKFDGTKDPHYHMDNIKQVINAKNVYKWHTQFEGFGMNLDGAALEWLRDLPKGAYTTLDQLEPDFIEAFSLTGMKHNTITKIYNFKQLEIETVRDCSKRLKNYCLRCPKIEIPNQEQLVSLFLEGLLNRKLHAALYPKKHKTLNACIKQAVELDDNVDEFRDGRPTRLGDLGSDKSSESRMVT